MVPRGVTKRGAPPEQVYYKNRLLKLPDKSFTIGRVTVDEDGEILNYSIEPGAQVQGYAPDKRTLVKELHDQIDRLTDEPIVEVE